jgi:hypothetical protein
VKQLGFRGLHDALAHVDRLCCSFCSTRVLQIQAAHQSQPVCVRYTFAINDRLDDDTACAVGHTTFSLSLLQYLFCTLTCMLRSMITFEAMHLQLLTFNITLCAARTAGSAQWRQPYPDAGADD